MGRRDRGQAWRLVHGLMSGKWASPKGSLLFQFLQRFLVGGAPSSDSYDIVSHGILDILLCFAAFGQQQKLKTCFILTLILLAFGGYLMSVSVATLTPPYSPGVSVSVVPFPQATTRTAAEGRPQLDTSTFQTAMLIPRIIHQTYRSLEALPEAVVPLRLSWRELNPGWAIQFWDDTSCTDFVRTEFPEYYAAYKALPKHVERADFFRYMVVLRHGGVYADIDCECKEPLDRVLQDTDSLVVGWESEYSSDAEAKKWHNARTRQIQQWAFAAAPNHPALRKVCDHIAANYDKSFSVQSNMDTLERTGPGAWTDAVLSTAAAEAATGSKWSVRFLPQVATGTHPHSKVAPELNPRVPGVVIQHHFLGGWKPSNGWSRGKKAGEHAWRFFRKLAFPLEPEGSSALAEGPPGVRIPVPETGRFSVSINLSGTRFAVFVNQAGHGDLQSREDVGAVLTRYGNWQAGMDKFAEPRAPAAIVGALSKLPDASDSVQPVFLDIGAGLGFYSLTAAARGHRVIATELSPSSLELFDASVTYNGFADLVTVRNVTLGDADSAGPVCVDYVHGGRDYWRAEELARGYADPKAHHAPPGGCLREAQRVTVDDLVPEGVRVGAVRVSAGAWTARVLHGALSFLETQQPRAILIEVDMEAMSRLGDREEMFKALQGLAHVGYSDMAHAGHICEERYQAMVRNAQRTRGAGSFADEVGPQPAWCGMDLSQASRILERNYELGFGHQNPLNAHGVELILLQRSSDTTSDSR